MWDCGACGCLAIAATVATCPMCGKERVMPKITVGGGASSALGAEAAPAAEAEPDAAVQEAPGAPVTPEPVEAAAEPSAPEAGPEPEAGEGDGEAAGEDEDDGGPADYATYPKPLLMELCSDRGLTVRGTKAELAERLAAYDTERAG